MISTSLESNSVGFRLSSEFMSLPNLARIFFPSGEPERKAMAASTLSIDDISSTYCNLAVLFCENRVSMPQTCNQSTMALALLSNLSLPILQGSAVEICSLIDQCFLCLYQDATMQFLDTNIRQGAGGMGSSTLRSGQLGLLYRFPFSTLFDVFHLVVILFPEVSSNSSPKKDIEGQNLALWVLVEKPLNALHWLTWDWILKLFLLCCSISQSSLNLSSLPSRSSRSLTRTNPNGSIARSESKLGPTANDMIKKYMEKVGVDTFPAGSRGLDWCELYVYTLFSSCIQSWRQMSCGGLHNLCRFGSPTMLQKTSVAKCLNCMDQKGSIYWQVCSTAAPFPQIHLWFSLLSTLTHFSGMRPFIPESDMADYEEFLESIGLGSEAYNSNSFHTDVYRLVFSFPCFRIECSAFSVQALCSLQEAA